ncbi:hypothetical protein, partial [Segetibacter koreensis]|uniref:hypothetical protein n=1 Tax=Segetibacter koreensis TaxID=398037 RepID=UPI0004769372
MEKTLPSFIENTIKWKKEKSLSFKKIGFTCFVSAFVFLLGFAPGKSFGQDISCTWTSVNASNLCVGSSSNFTLTAKTADIDGADIPAGKQVLITFPDGLDPTSITSGSTFQGFDISLTILPNTVSFNVPSEISVSKGSEFVILLNGVTNKLPGDHQLSMKIDNSTGSQDIFDAGVNSQVTINPGKPTTPGDITGPVTACKNTTGNNYSINTVTDATSYTWDYTGSGATITGSGTDVTIAFAANATSGNLTVTANNSCGSSAPQTLAITVNAAPAIPGDITGSTTACKNTTGNNYSINAVTDATSYTWDYTGSGVTITGSGTSITVAFAANATSGNLSVTANNACGSSAPQTLAITVNAAPATPGDITGSTTACKNTTGNNYSINAVTDATSYTWDYTGSGATITGSGTSVTVAFAANATSGNLSVTANNACGSSAPQTLAITVNAAPATPGDITGSTTVCKNTTGNNYSINAVTGATSYTWDYTGSGVTITGSGTSITVAFAANATSGNLSVTANNSCGNSNAKTLAITVND